MAMNPQIYFFDNSKETVPALFQNIANFINYLADTFADTKYPFTDMFTSNEIATIFKVLAEPAT